MKNVLKQINASFAQISVTLAEMDAMLDQELAEDELISTGSDSLNFIRRLGSVLRPVSQRRFRALADGRVVERNVWPNFARYLDKEEALGDLDLMTREDEASRERSADHSGSCTPSTARPPQDHTSRRLEHSRLQPDSSLNSAFDFALASASPTDCLAASNRPRLSTKPGR